jgi:hypothetical protein
VLTTLAGLTGRTTTVIALASATRLAVATLAIIVAAVVGLLGTIG